MWCYHVDNIMVERSLWRKNEKREIVRYKAIITVHLKNDLRTPASDCDVARGELAHSSDSDNQNAASIALKT